MSELGHHTGSTCPFCGKFKPLANTLREPGVGPSPSVGDAAICISCGEWSIFDAEMKMRRPTVEELIELGEDENVQRATAVWKRMDRIMRRRH